MADLKSLLRYEFIYYGGGRSERDAEILSAEGAAPLKSGFLEILGSPTPSNKQVVTPDSGGHGGVFLRLYLVGAAQAYVSVGPAPDPNTEPRLLVFSGNLRTLSVRPGDRISVLNVGYDAFQPTVA